MKTAGLIGGIAPESTIEYYRLIISLYRRQRGDGSYPPIIINSIDLTRMLGLVAAGDFRALTVYLLDEVRRLADAGADFGLFASNTPHLVFDEVASQAAIPLISIVDTCRAAVQALALTKVGLLGTKFTMQGGFYQRAFAARGIEVVVPEGGDQAYIHEKYMSELVNARFLPETRIELLGVVERLRQREGIEAVILGGTELPLILRDIPDSKIVLLDTARIHVEAVVARMLPEVER